jgi:hypothetical protein
MSLLFLFGGAAAFTAASSTSPTSVYTTLGDLKNRIITETNRDDLVDTLAPWLTMAIQQAINFYAAERWWFTEGTVTPTCVVGNQYTPLPAGFRFRDALFIIVGNVRYRLRIRQMVDIEALYTTPITGQPTDAAFFGSSLRLWPTPNVAYPIIADGVFDTAALDYSDDTSTNSWLAYAYDLITARAKIILYRDFLSAQETDPRLGLAMQQEASAYDRTKGETNRRITTGRVRPSW